MLLVIGDLNARTGSDRERVLGKEGFNTINNSGERLLKICQENNLVVGGSLFQHKDVHKITWKSPNGRKFSQIDHIIINQKWRRSLQDVKARRGADVGSDHTLVIGTIALKLRRAKPTEKRQPRFGASKFRDSETCGKFQVEKRNRFTVLEDEQELDIAAFNKVLTDASDKVLGYKKYKKEEWITGDTWKKIDERKERKKKLNQAKSQRLKDRLQTAYSEQDKEVKRMTRKGKKEFVDKLADQAENAAEGDLRSLYEITKALSTLCRINLKTQL